MQEKSFFKKTSILWHTISPLNPETGVIVCNQSGTFQAYRWNVSTGEIFQVTNEENGLLRARMSPDGQYIVFLKEKEPGSETGHLVKVNLKTKEEINITQELPDFLLYSTGLDCITFSDDGKRCFVSGCIKDKNFIAVVENDSAKIVYQSEKTIAYVIPNNDGSLISFSQKNESEKGYNLIAFDVNEQTIIQKLNDGEDAVLTAHQSHEGEFIVTSNASGKDELFFWDPIENNKNPFSFITGSPPQGNLTPLGVKENKVLIHAAYRAHELLFLYDINDQCMEILEFPEGSKTTLFSLFGHSYFHPTENKIFFTLSNLAVPPNVYSFCLENQSIKKELDLGNNKISDHWKWHSDSILSASGNEIQFWKAFPNNTKGNLPTVLHIHGGPTVAMMPEFTPEALMYLKKGIAFVSINYTGSTTFGKKFKDDVWGQASQKELLDIQAVYDYLVGNGFSDPNKMFIHGWSYGGYLSLMAGAKLPKLWAGIMPVVPIACFLRAYTVSPAYGGLFKKLLGIVPKENCEVTKKASPISYIEEYLAPICLIHAENDVRTPKEQVQAFIDKMENAEKAIEVTWFPQGHVSMRLISEVLEELHTIFLNFVLQRLSELE